MIVVDTLAIVAILLAEDEGAAFRSRIEAAGGALVSAVSAVELAAVAGRDDALCDAARSLLNEPYVAVEPVDAVQAAIASDAYRRFGKGRSSAETAAAVQGRRLLADRCRTWLGCYHASASHVMRTIVDLPEEQVRRLGEFCRREGVSRAEAVRRAVGDYLAAHALRERQDAFGMWRDRRVDGLEYEGRLRREWS